MQLSIEIFGCQDVSGIEGVMRKQDMYFENKTIENIKLEGEVLEEAEFVDCEFRQCVFENCTLRRCNFKGCTFTNCNIISLKTKHSQSKNTELSNCNLIGIHWNELMPAGGIFDTIRKMSGCFLKYNTFMGMRFTKFDFSDNNIQESLFDDCNLKESNFKGCQLERTQYTNCDMRKADFRDTSGYQIDLLSNQLEGARFSFPDVVNLLNSIGVRVE